MTDPSAPARLRTAPSVSVCRWSEPDPPAQALAAHCRSSGSDYVLLLLESYELPPWAQERIIEILAHHQDVAVLGLLNPASVETNPVRPGSAVPAPIDVAGIDSMLFLQQHEVLWDSDQVPPAAVVVNAQVWRDSGGDETSWDAWMSAIKTTHRIAVTSRVFTTDPDVALENECYHPHPDHLQPPSPLISVQLALAPALDQQALPRCWPGVEDRPTQLHLLHGWGGGAQKWVSDYVRADEQRINLVLRSEGNPISKDHGQWLVLYTDPAGGPPIRRWPLSPAIDCVDLIHESYERVLRGLITSFPVDGLVVSSLIGHSLAALEMDIPTAVVLHDYFPAWPRLDIWFENQSAFDTQALSQAVRELPERFEFKAHDPDYWLNLSRRYLSRLENKTLIAPSQSVRACYPKLAPGLDSEAISVVPHGIEEMRPVVFAAPEQGTRMRLLVLGAVSPHKGEALLKAALPGLTQHADVYLFGTGRGGRSFSDLPQVHVVPRYEPEELEALLHELKPHLALLLSTVSETFSYTLLECLALGLPVIATPAGNMADVIQSGDFGLLCDPTPESVVASVDTLRSDPERLSTMAAAAAAHPYHSPEAMVAAHHRLFGLKSRLEPAPRTQETGPLSLAAAHQSLLIAQDINTGLSADKADAERELAERAEWAFGLERQLKEKSRWAKKLDKQLSKAQLNLAELDARYEQDMRKAEGALGKLQGEFEERTQWALELDDMRIRHEAELKRLLLVEEQRNRMINSRSWRATRPLRALTARLRTLRDRIKFAATRTSFNLRRTKNSLATRGVAGTLGRAAAELRRGEPPPTVRPPPAADTGAPIEFASITNPTVSIVVPVYNQWAYTEACLRSLCTSGDQCPLEVIVVNDASTDVTATALEGIPGVQTVHNETNLGFIGSCNAGAAQARGEFLIFLNNDTTVTAGWLDNLLQTFDRYPEAGLVGAKLIYPDGTLQEAGGIIFSDATGWNYGRGEDPSLPQFEYVREVDYISGAAIGLRKSLFEALGGFDSHYAPAYYEDTDLAFKIRDAGYKVLYQPESVVVHYEGISSGTDLSSGTKRYQVVNHRKFHERWDQALKAQPAPGSPIHLAATHRHRSRVLVVDACTPTPDQDSGSVRMTNLLQLLVDRGYHVTFLAHNMAYEGSYTKALQAMGVEALYQPFVTTPHSWLREFGDTLDVVIVSRYYVAADYVDLIRTCCPKARFVFDTVDLHFLREQRLAELEQDDALAATAQATRKAELGVAEASDLTLVVSPHEKALLADVAPELKVEVLSNIHAVPGRSTEFDARRDIWFVGGFQHPPNVDAVQYCVAEILPLVREKLPDVKLIVVGSKAPAELQSLRAPGLEFRGFVEDLDPFLNGCRLAIAPLRYGAGVKGKVNMSMSHGQPVVATPPAVEGMYVEHGVEVMVGANAREFADLIVEVYSDPDLWKALSDAGLENVKKHFSFEAAAAALDRILP